MFNLAKAIGIFFGTFGMLLGIGITLLLVVYFGYLAILLGVIGGIIYLIKVLLDDTSIARNQHAAKHTL